MIGILVCMTALTQPHPQNVLIETGICKYYRAGMMQTVITNRHLWHAYRLSGAVGTISTTHPERIGETAIISIGGGPRIRVFIADVSGPADIARHRREKLRFEVDYELAVRYGFVDEGKARGQIWYTQP